MDFAGERYYKLNRILLLALGLWPDQISTFKSIQIIFFQTLFISFLICQCIPFFVKQYNLKCIIKMLSHVFLTCMFIINYNVGLFFSDKIKYIFDSVRYDWNMVEAQEEVQVLRKYANDAKFHTVFVFLMGTCFSLGLPLIICLPLILDVIIPMNESRPRQTIINVEYFVDEETYFLAIWTHICIHFYAGFITIMAITTIILAYISHICALFRISSYRMEHIFDKNVQLLLKDIKQSVVYNSLINAVHVHRRALDSVNIMLNSFSPIYLLLLVLILPSTSLSIFNLINAVTSPEIVELIMCGSILFLHLYSIFLGNYIGQDIIDNSTDICQATYNAQWYAAPLGIQKLILLIIQRSNKRCTLLIGGLFDASLEGFSTLLSMCVSYLMVLQSVGPHKESGKK
ncbi:PREDICTED: uncharacterized protein LOC105565391 [Vollenhovia emeryi]|uniref:uncharacterized protein LOC105565391 n=1 Tax=Vollenhovia emeryi TaxID=411798 RepID=UPI0005F49C75|nr:PREDICTED: uncharacterized protein LOC105565391 [Vollenhovia emeryi]